MMSHPLTFLIAYLVCTFVLAFIGLGPLTVFGVLLFKRHMEKRFVEGVYLGAGIASWIFMILHYLLYLRGYRITQWTTLLKDVFYPPSL